MRYFLLLALASLSGFSLTSFAKPQAVVTPVYYKYKIKSRSDNLFTLLLSQVNSYKGLAMNYYTAEDDINAEVITRIKPHSQVTELLFDALNTKPLCYFQITGVSDTEFTINTDIPENDPKYYWCHVEMENGEPVIEL